MNRKLISLALAACMLPAAQAGAQSTSALKDLSVDELLNLRVTSVSKRSEPLSDAAASIFVLTADTIRRSGATTLPEALRLAPTLQVARIDTVEYAISGRGFNNAIGNKLLVLIDGRTVYTPLYSGVFWDQQDVMLEDVDRIEIITGPGATLWGANAVNGVINVITRSASDTTGTLVVAGAGDNERSGAARFGTQLGSGAVRFYAKYAEWDHSTRSTGDAALDDWRRAQVGFRSDWEADDSTFTLQGDAYDGNSQDRGSVGPYRARRYRRVRLQSARPLAAHAERRLRCAAADVLRSLRPRRLPVLQADGGYPRRRFPARNRRGRASDPVGWRLPPRQG